MSDDRPSVRVDPELEEIVPEFLEMTLQDLHELEAALKRRDGEAAGMYAHRIKGSAGGYGFHHVTELGAAMEEKASSHAWEEAARLAGELGHYLDRVDIVYE